MEGHSRKLSGENHFNFGKRVSLKEEFGSMILNFRMIDPTVLSNFIKQGGLKEDYKVSQSFAKLF